MKQLKAIELLKAITENEGTHLWLDDGSGYPKSYIYEAIKELEGIQEEKDLLEEYVQFARLHIETYRCKCGSLGRVGYLCSNKECSEV